MATKWVVTTPSDRLVLDNAQRGQTTFTVTNPTDRVDRAVFDVVVADGADAAWFGVDEPQRRVPPSGSVSYLMTAEIPVDAPPGAYSVRGRVYSADSAPEEGSVLSGRVAIEVKDKEAPPKRRLPPWWVFLVAGLTLVVVVVVVLVLVLAGGGPPPEPERTIVPDLTRESRSQATINLAVFGLSVGTVRHELADTPDQVVYQSVPGGARVAQGSTVDLVVTTALAPPKPTAPKENSTVPKASVAPPTRPVPSTPPLPSPGASMPATPSRAPSPSASPTAPPDLLRWTDSDPFVSRWQVTIEHRVCTTVVFLSGLPTCAFPTAAAVQVDHPGYTPVLVPGTPFGITSSEPDSPTGKITLFSTYTDDTYRWRVAAIDDFGNVGPASPWMSFTVH